MSLPLAIHERLTRLTELATAAAPSRAEIIGMLIAGAKLDADELERALVAYRKKTVGDVLPEPTSEDGPTAGRVVQIATRRPGRPRRP
jgi:hypothetical protein